MEALVFFGFLALLVLSIVLVFKIKARRINGAQDFDPHILLTAKPLPGELGQLLDNID